MDASQSIDLATPSPELDEAVAKACGLRGFIYATVQATPESRYFVLEDRAQGRRWEPSTDLNAAFEAAEKVGLFDRGTLRDGRHYYTILQKMDRDLWATNEIHRNRDNDGYSEPIASDLVVGADEQATPALAICAAILAWKARCSRAVLLGGENV